MADSPARKRKGNFPHPRGGGKGGGPRGRGGGGGGRGGGRGSWNAYPAAHAAFGIEPGMRGVLITCLLGKEGQAVKEIYNLFAEYAEGLPCDEELPTVTTTHPATLTTLRRRDGEAVDLSDSEDDEPPVKPGVSIEDSVAAELEELNKTDVLGRASFRSINTSTDCVIFVQCRGVDPVSLVHKLLADVDETQVLKTRYAQRFVPFAGTCRANINDIRKLAQQLLAPHFHQEGGEPKTFKIIPKIRQCGGVQREEIIKVVAEVVGDNHKAEMENAELVILVEAFRNICGISVVRDYMKFKKYNVVEMIREPITEEKSHEE